MTKSSKHQQLRLRVFAGPNGSGKSTVIDFVREFKSNGHFIDFGEYINADLIAVALREKRFSFNEYSVSVNNKEFRTIALASGLVNADFPEDSFTSCYSFHKNCIRIIKIKEAERLAQIIADFLRKKLLAEKKRFSFETVFSHSSKLDIMRAAVAEGYKVYLYFVSTESPKINLFRVKARKAQGGHDVPADKIVSRYYRSLDLLYEAGQLCYQAFFFDNSEDGANFKMFANFKIIKGRKKWDKMKKEDVPQWFLKYYSAKAPNKSQ